MTIHEYSEIRKKRIQSIIQKIIQTIVNIVLKIKKNACESRLKTIDLSKIFSDDYETKTNLC